MKTTHGEASYPPESFRAHEGTHGPLEHSPAISAPLRELEATFFLS